MPAHSITSSLPDVNLSIHPARVTARKLPPSGSSRYNRLAQVNGDDAGEQRRRHGEATDRLLDFFLLEKAFYEIEYELAHRPDWLRVLAGTWRILSARLDTA